MKNNLKGLAPGVLATIVLAMIVALAIIVLIDSQTGFIRNAGSVLSNIITNALKLP